MPKKVKSKKVKRSRKVKRASQTQVEEQTAALGEKKINPNDKDGVRKVAEHLQVLSGVGIIEPKEGMLTVTMNINERKFQQTLDGVMALRWDNAKKRFDKEDVIKHLGMCAFYQTTFAIAKAQATMELERLEQYYAVWLNEARRNAEEEVRKVRLKEIEAGQRPKGNVGQITQAQIESQIDADTTRRQAKLGFEQDIREARSNKSLMGDLFNTMVQNGSYLQTLARIYNVEESSYR